MRTRSRCRRARSRTATLRYRLHHNQMPLLGPMHRHHRDRPIESDEPAVVGDRQGEQVCAGDLQKAVQASAVNHGRFEQAAIAQPEVVVIGGAGPAVE